MTSFPLKIENSYDAFFDSRMYLLFFYFLLYTLRHFAKGNNSLRLKKLPFYMVWRQLCGTMIKWKILFVVAEKKPPNEMPRIGSTHEHQYLESFQIRNSWNLTNFWWKKSNKAVHYKSVEKVGRIVIGLLAETVCNNTKWGKQVFFVSSVFGQTENIPRLVASEKTQKPFSTTTITAKINV